MSNTTLALGSVVPTVTAGAVSALDGLSKRSEIFKKELASVKLNQGLLTQIGALQAKLAGLNQTGRGTSAEARNISVELGKVSDDARKAGLNVANLEQELITLGRQSRGLQLGINADALKGHGRSLRGDARGQIADKKAMGYALIKPVLVASEFEAQLREISITGELSKAQELKLGASVMNISSRTGQLQGDVLRGVNTMVTEGMSPERAEEQAATISKTATATKTDIDDLARMTVNFEKSLRVKNVDLAFNQAAKADKLGGFELSNMARWFPQLGGFMTRLGVTGNEAVVSMASRLQIAMRTAGSKDEAAQNFKNYLSKITSADTIKDFKKQGVNLTAELARAAAKGIDPISASIDQVEKHMAKKAPAAAAQLKALGAALSGIENPAERVAELERRRGMIESIGKSAGLGDLFQDMPAVSYLMAELTNRDALKGILDQVRSGKGNSGRDVIDEDFEKRKETIKQKLKDVSIAETRLGVAIGSAMSPLLDALVPGLTRMADGISEFANKHPQLIKFGAAALGGALGLSVLGMAGKWLAGGLLSAISPVTRLIGFIRRFSSVGGLAKAVIGKMLTVFRSLWNIVRMLRGPFMLAARAILFVGRALLMNPIGLLVTGIAIAAFLIYKNWGPISAFFGKAWKAVKAAFTSAWDWLKALPARFMQLGGDLLNGLMNGITARLDALKKAVAGIGTAVKNWFAEKLGIHSPSRVFMGFGQNIGEGAEVGLKRSIPGVRGAVNTLAGVALAGATMGAAAGGVKGPMAPGGARGMHITFAPNITLAAGTAPEVVKGINQAMQLSVHELEKMMRRVLGDQNRRSF